jgi:hypothetical protein
VGYVFRQILGPHFGRVEGDDPEGIAVLYGDKIANHRFSEKRSEKILGKTE